MSRRPESARPGSRAVCSPPGFPAIVIDAMHASSALKSGFRNKTDRNDARGIADPMRVNKFRAVWVKWPADQAIALC